MKAQAEKNAPKVDKEQVIEGLNKLLKTENDRTRDRNGDMTGDNLHEIGKSVRSIGSSVV